MKIRDAWALLFPRKPVYDLDRAVVVVFSQLPADARQRLDHADVEAILRMAFRYREERGLGESREGRPAARIPAEQLDEAVAYIRTKAEQRGHACAEGDIRAVLEAEVVFMRKAGLIHD